MSMVPGLPANKRMKPVTQLNSRAGCSGERVQSRHAYNWACHVFVLASFIQATWLRTAGVYMCEFEFMLVCEGEGVKERERERGAERDMEREISGSMKNRIECVVRS